MKPQRAYQDAASRSAIVVFALFALAAALLGGSSRPDAVQIVALRPIAALFLIPVIYFFSTQELRSIRVPFALLCLLAGWMTCQIIPLPPGLWHSIPGIEPVLNASQQVGMNSVWRPISLVPFRTQNALASLVVPFVALLLPVMLKIRQTHIFYAIIAISVLSALLGVLQILGDRNSSLYLYEFVNRGSPTGFFANRNHAAVLLSLALVTIAYVLTARRQRYMTKPVRMILAIAFAIVLIVALISGSRAGFLTVLLALAASVTLLYLQTAASPAGAASKKPPPVAGVGWRAQRKIIAAGAIVGVCVIAGSLALFGRVPAFERLFETGSTWDDLRWSIFPTLVAMMKAHFVLGTGFGSFEEVYHIYEPTNLLLPEYVNMAHNDLAQLVIEGGIPAILLLAAFSVWLLKAVWVSAVQSGHSKQSAIYWAAIFMIILMASLADYPLRTPLFQAIAVWLIVAFCREQAAELKV